ncbi:hypothetical protein HMPREF0202_00897 [Cetobacterium somerae ATCC BAA-474]|uniref:HTH araC/xylS-type domain-containing protein n=1 Tax=Cetobacterium somerae ATCC BAA-474 TaxID=1319815 RepID=U7VEG0_9FUSO|nr:AraC family transcriptional regulator [Cetobacterium somerae]ERT69163.1 hypothetical protein HMPREF0202_00897 [Cetobacterium somerae ATCC BAA-474]
MSSEIEVIKNSFYELFRVNYKDVKGKRRYFKDLENLSGTVIRICTKGKGLYYYNSEEYVFFEEGDLIICNEFYFNSILVLTKECKLDVFRIKDCSLLETLNNKIKKKEYRRIKIYNLKKVLFEIEKALKIEDKELTFFKLLLDVIFYLGERKNNIGFNYLNDKNFMDILIYIDSNIDRRITVSDVEKEFKTYNKVLKEQFKKYLGIFPSEYILNQKLTKAAILLKTTDYKISYISDILSFSSPSAFTLIFKRKFKESPSNYRRK